MRRIISPSITAIIMAVGLLLAILSGYVPSVFPDFATAHPVRFWGAVIGCVALLIGYAFAEARNASSSTAAPVIPDDQAQRNRAAMLAKVRQTWIVGLLDRSIASDARIALDLETRPDAVIDPIDLSIQRPNRPVEPLPPGIAIKTVYDQLGGALLILGAPGAGKTTLLLELARDLLDHADADPIQPIPVVFPLSSWAAERKPLVAWLIDELVLRYQVPRKQVEAWLDADTILPLLDGLDEVAAEHRSACADAINRYRQEHGTLPLVVCSRIADYEALGAKLQLHGAIVAQPLNRDQVRSYLRAVGVPAIPRTDSPLWDLLDTPLMLTVAALAYAGQPLDAIATADPIAARERLFAAYIDRMFQRNTAGPPFTDAETRQYLAYLAYQLQQHNQTTLYLEQMQPDWLPAPQQQRWNRLVHIIVGLISGLVVGLVVGWFSGLGFGLSAGLGAGLSLGQNAGRTNSIDPIEVVRWSWREARLPFTEHLRSILMVGLGAGLVVGLSAGLMVGLGGGLVVGLGGGLVVGLVFGLIGVLVSGLSKQEIDRKTSPNQGIQRSGLNALLVGLVFGLVVWLVVGLGIGLVGALGVGLGGGLDIGLVIGLVGALVIGLRYGSRAYIQHYLLRLLLIRNSSIPLHLVPFLDYASQRIFLRRVGGGYLFIHRLLLEHFAKQYEQEQSRQSSAIQ